MLAFVALSLFAQAPAQTDPYGPLLFREEALLIRSRLLKPDKPKEALTAERLTEIACESLFDDCRSALDEFAKKRAVEAHRDELDALATTLRDAPSFVIAATGCFGEYDFKAKRLPVKSFQLLAPAREGPSVHPYESPLEFKLSRTWSSLAVDAAAAERLVTQFPGVRCAEFRIEVAAPKKPAPWHVIRGNFGEHDFEPVAVPVTVKRARILAADGSTLVTLL